MSTILVFMSKIPGDGAPRTVNETEQNTIKCSAVQHGIDLPVVTKGSNRTPGYSMHGSVRLTHALDVATPKLRQAAALGEDQGEVHIIRTTLDGGSTVDAEVIKLGQVRVANVSMETLPSADGTGCAELPIEVFTLDYAEIVWNWRYAPEGGTAETIEGGWDTDDMMVISKIPPPPAPAGA